MNYLKKVIVKSPIHKLIIDQKARIDLSTFSKENDNITGFSTVYCISPYKTATRYLSGCYRKEISAHEPLHYLSLRELEKNFNKFFVRRLNTLNLKLECSGFLCTYIGELVTHPVTRDLDYIVILRKPSSWITSAVNHWNQQSKRRIRYHYTNLLFWKEKVGINLDALLSVSEKDRANGLIKLAKFYLSFTQKTQQLKNVYYVKIEEIDSFLPVLDKLINETSNTEKSRKYANKNKAFQYKNEELDKEYNELVNKLMHNN